MVNSFVHWCISLAHNHPWFFAWFYYAYKFSCRWLGLKGSFEVQHPRLKRVVARVDSLQAVPEVIDGFPVEPKHLNVVFGFGAPKLFVDASVGRTSPRCILVADSFPEEVAKGKELPLSTAPDFRRDFARLLGAGYFRIDLTGVKVSEDWLYAVFCEVWGDSYLRYLDTWNLDLEIVCGDNPKLAERAYDIFLVSYIE